MKKAPVISVKNLSVSYGETLAVSDFSFSIERGDFVGLTGPNGSGKSTLVKAILGLVEPSEGEIFLWGKSLKKFADFARIGYVPQRQNFLNKLLPASVEEVVLTGMLGAKKFPRLIGKDDRKTAAQVLADLKIKNLSSKLFSQLSGGQQQKVLLARALVTNPELLILDEPSSALDQNARRNFFQMLKKLNEQEKVTIIIISHDTGYIGQYAKKLLYIDQKLIFFGLINEFCPGKDKAACFEKKGEHLIWHQHE